MPTPITDIEQINTALFSILWNISGMQALVGENPETNQPQVYFNASPVGAPMPLCIFRFMGGAPILGNGCKKIFSKMVYNIQLVTDDTSLAGILPVYTEMEQVLQFDQTVSNSTFAGMHIESYLSHSREDNGKVIQYLGYQISAMVYNNSTQFLQLAE
jgi:hypothetical protein